MLRYATILASIFVYAYSESFNGDLPEYQVPKEECCARAHYCPRTPFDPPSCKDVTQPQCEDYPCRHSTIQLRSIYYQPSGLSVMCCTVMNCPTIYYSDCSYKPDGCEGQHDICTPERYRLHHLTIRCPNGMGYEVYRYLPYCCSCSKCPGDQLEHHYKG